jgi:hypothetical protein
MTSPTTRADRLLLFLTIVLLPLENHFPAVGGASVLFVLFGLLALYLFVRHPQAVVQVLPHRVFVAAYLFLLVSVIGEFSSPSPIYLDIARFAFMIAGSIVVASLCRDELALRGCLYGYMCAAAWMSVVIFSTFFQSTHNATASDYTEASMIRSSVFGNGPVRADLNTMGFVCVQGAVVSYAFGMAKRELKRLITFLGIAVVFTTASLCTMSRSTVIMTLITCGVIVLRLGLKHGKGILIAIVFISAVLWAAPDVTWVRLGAGIQGSASEDGRLESRFALYEAAFDHLPEYVLTGVGQGNCLTDWGLKSGFVDCAWVHNSFLHVTIFWGLPALLAFILLIYWAYRCIPSSSGRDRLELAVLGIAVSGFLYLFFVHNFYDKLFALALGILAGGDYWIWRRIAVNTSLSALSCRLQVPGGPRVRRVKSLHPSTRL